MKKILTTIIVFAAVVYLQSCEQQAFAPQPPISLERDLSALNNIDQFTETEVDIIKIYLAKSLSKSLNDPEVRSFLKQEIVKEFDGDYDVLFNAAKHTKIGEMTFAQHLIVNLPSLDDQDYKAARTQERIDKKAIIAFLKNLDIDTDKLPLLNISIPFYGDEWNIDQATIPVAPATQDAVEKHLEGIDVIAYHQDGSTVTLKSNELPEFPVIVVGENERIIPKRKIIASKAKTQAICAEALYYSDVNYDYYHGDALVACENPPYPPTSSPTPSLTTSGCERDGKSTYAYDQMRNIKFLSMDKLKEAEGWLSGRIELRAIMINYTGATANSPFTMLFYESRDVFRGCRWFNCWVRNYDPKRDMFIWNQTTDGDRILIRFYEDNKNDGGKISIKIPFKVKLWQGVVETGFEVGVEIPLKNKLLGDNYVYYCVDVHRIYNNSWLQFQIIPEGL